MRYKDAMKQVVDLVCTRRSFRVTNTQYPLSAQVIAMRINGEWVTSYSENEAEAWDGVDDLRLDEVLTDVGMVHEVFRITKPYADRVVGVGNWIVDERS